jgi:hypothetical protein
MNKMFVSAAAMVVFAAGTASASTIAPIFDADRIAVESSGNRPSASGDINNNGALDLGLILPGEKVGIAGRIVTAVDNWTFQTTTPWTMSLVNLDLDDNQGFDSSNITNPSGSFAGNGDTTTALFSLFDASGNPDSDPALFSANLTATMHGLITGLNFSGGAGSYLLRIDGAAGSPGATYDIGISAVPIPASLPLLLGGIGALAAMRRRKAAA